MGRVLLVVSGGGEGAPSAGVTGAAYLAGNRVEPPVLVLNFSDRYDYLSEAYYVALAAEARGQRVFPDMAQICALRHDRHRAEREDEIRARIRELADGFRRPHLPALDGESADGLRADPRQARSTRRAGATVGILFTPSEPFGASSAESVADFRAAARRIGLDTVEITRANLGVLDEVDALFIRDLTSPGSYTYEASTTAQRRGIPVIDDPSSIRRCSNKIFQHERLSRHGVPTPRSAVVKRGDDPGRVVERLGLPLVLKAPEGSFCRGVHKVDSIAAARACLAELHLESEAVLAQEFVPTDFDWRIGLLDGVPLFACRYHMVPGHWQVIRHGGSEVVEGDAETVPVATVPGPVLEAAQAAGRAMGRGLYGIDLKLRDGRPLVIEVNANPDVNTDFEAAHPGDRVWERIAGYFRRRVLAFDHPERSPAVSELAA